MRQGQGFGHSWVAGAGSSRSTKAMLSRVARELGFPILNSGVGGAVAAETAEVVHRETVAPAELYIVMIGLNDARLHGTSAAAMQQFADACRDVVRHLSSAGAVFLVEQPLLLDYSGYPPFNRGRDAAVIAYNAALREVAGSNPKVTFVPVAGWRPAAMLATDGVHPNDAGHALLARAVCASYGLSVSLAES